MLAESPKNQGGRDTTVLLGVGLFLGKKVPPHSINPLPISLPLGFLGAFVGFIKPSWSSTH